MMALHFSREEFAARRAAATAALKARGLDGLLMFRQESMYYLTGYDTFGYVFFQCVPLGAEGNLPRLPRAPAPRQPGHPPPAPDTRIGVEGPEADPPRALRATLDPRQCRGQRLGVEYEAYGLTARNG